MHPLILQTVIDLLLSPPTTDIYAKIALCLFSALFIGFSFFNSPLSQQGLQNQM